MLDTKRLSRTASEMQYNDRIFDRPCFSVHYIWFGKHQGILHARLESEILDEYNQAAAAAGRPHIILRDGAPETICRLTSTPCSTILRQNIKERLLATFPSRPIARSSMLWALEEAVSRVELKRWGWRECDPAAALETSVRYLPPTTAAKMAALLATRRQLLARLGPPNEFSCTPPDRSRIQEPLLRATTLAVDEGLFEDGRGPSRMLERILAALVPDNHSFSYKFPLSPDEPRMMKAMATLATHPPALRAARKALLKAQKSKQAWESEGKTPDKKPSQDGNVIRKTPGYWRQKRKPQNDTGK